MTAQVIFLNKWLDCPDEKKREHAMIQALIQEEVAKYLYEIRDYNAFQKAISKQKSANLFRQKMYVIRNVENTEDSSQDN
jgi:hypothetical protein